MSRTWTSSVLAAAALAVAAPAGAHPARGIAVGSDGRVYFSDLERVWEIGRDGRLRLLRGHRGVHTHALAIDRSGALVGEDSAYDPASDTYRETIWALRPDGRFRVVFGPGPAQRGIGLLADGRGCRYHADQTGRGAGAAAGRPLLFRKCPGRAADRLVGSAADDRAFRPVLANDVAGVAWGPYGSFWFRQGGVVRAVAPTGAVRVAARSLTTENFGIAVDRGGTLYVAEGAKRRILAVKPGGERRVAAVSAAPWSPTGVATTAGALYVLEATDYRPGTPLRMRVRRVAAGNAQVLATVTIPAA